MLVPREPVEGEADPLALMADFLASNGVLPDEGEILTGVTLVVHSSVDDPDERVLLISAHDDPLNQFRQALSYLHHHYDAACRSQ